MRKPILATLAAGLFATAAYAMNPMVGGAEMYPEKNIVENAMNSKDHTTLVAAVKAAGLVETLQGKGPFTVFAPVNENKEKLATILACHVVPAAAFAADVQKMVADDGGMHKVKTVGGCELTASVKDGKVMISDENGTAATVTIADVKQSNGVIHVIDKVLLPKS